MLGASIDVQKSATVVRFFVSGKIRSMQKPISITIGETEIPVRQIWFKDYDLGAIQKIGDTMTKSHYRMRETVIYGLAVKKSDFVSSVDVLVNVEEEQSFGPYKGKLLGVKPIPNTDECEVSIQAERTYDGVFPRNFWG